MAINFTLPLRIAQAVLAIIILGLTAYAVNAWNGNGHWHWSPAEINYMLFCSIWTILALAYLLIAPVRFETAAHKYGILAAEALTMIFWFAAFIALAVLLTDLGCSSHWGVCRAATAATVFAAFEWLLFAATTLMAGLHCWRTRGTHNTRHDPAIETRAAV
ncbi:hypothetical protein EJ06DRAFT_532933 [Trichodelitschia bisporula]|uniref:MARVEL domain-containing protein n=1 Tax=Trichodelitschia bisporula TaxID=703511 RepID=A0A6G1HMR8_9PEZI|nr:hypothetical protein EJ06DRAFT_532933 [Trichodelitschia bisporula]